MNTNPDEIKHQFQFNLHKLMGLPVDDCDLPRIAAIFDCDLSLLTKMDGDFRAEVNRMAQEIKTQCSNEVKKLQAKAGKVICIGDSITSDRKSYQKILQTAFGETGAVSFIDAAISGNTVQDLMDRFYSTILIHEFDAAIIFIGTNDSRMLHDGSLLPYTRFSEYEDKAKYLIRIIKTRKANVYLVTLPHIDLDRLRASFPDRNFYYSAVHIDSMNALIRKIAAETSSGLIDLATALKTNGDVLEPDGIHLNSKGQLLLAKMALTEIAKDE